MARCNVCDQVVPDAELLDHLRVLHPEQWDDGVDTWPDGEPVIVDSTVDDVDGVLEIPTRDGVPVAIRPHEMREVTAIFVADRELPAELVVCPTCKVLWMETAFDTDASPWVAICPKGHRWPIP